MCSIAGMIELSGNRIPGLAHKLNVMNDLQAHRGPDGHGVWMHQAENVGMAHRRLSIIDIASGQQPMTDHHGNWVCFNGEIYNYIELKQQLGGTYETTSDTEVILRAYEVWGEECVEHFSGMFAFALWDEKRQALFCARDHFGIKPFYYTVVDNTLYFASEMKALLPFLPSIETNPKGFQDYLVFQFCMEGRTLFQGIEELEPAHRMTITADGSIKRRRYWQVYYRPDIYHTEQYFHDELEAQFQRSIKYHVRSDVPVGGYVSGGVDSSITSAMARDLLGESFVGFTGKYNIGPDYDESAYARTVAREKDFKLYELDITAQDFIDNIGNVIYALDAPVAGPGSFSQYMISRLAASTARWSWADKAATRSSAAIPGIWWRTSSSASRAPLRGRRKRAPSWSPTSPSSPTSPLFATTSPCSAASGARGCSMSPASATSSSSTVPPAWRTASTGTPCPPMIPMTLMNGCSWRRMWISSPIWTG